MKRVAAILLNSIILVGVAAAVVVAVDLGHLGADIISEASDEVLTWPSAIVFTLLFCTGALLAVCFGKPWHSIALLPILVLALSPVFVGPRTLFQVPPSGIVLFTSSFDRDLPCPPGWELAEELAGYMPIGTGQRRDDRPNYALNQAGGDEWVRLSANHIPPHQHPFTDSTLHSEKASANDYYTCAGTCGKPKRQNISGTTGNNRDSHDPFSIMPPHYPVNFCKRARP